MPSFTFACGMFDIFISTPRVTKPNGYGCSSLLQWMIDIISQGTYQLDTDPYTRSQSLSSLRSSEQTDMHGRHLYRWGHRPSVKLHLLSLHSAPQSVELENPSLVPLMHLDRNASKYCVNIHPANISALDDYDVIKRSPQILCIQWLYFI